MPPPPSIPQAAEPVDVRLSSPEPTIASRVPPPEPERPFPANRRAIFFDVENTSRAEHIARVIDHLGVDRLGRRTDVIAVGNWKVVGQDTARLLARHGAHLVHSAPSTGVRDWSDLRIAVTAGVWLAAARPGDEIEIISDDRAFDAVGDVAATLGIAFRRLSYRQLAGVPRHEVEEPRPAEHEFEPRSRRRRRGRRRPMREQGGAPREHVGAAREHGAPPRPIIAAVPSTPTEAPRQPEPAATAHTAPHDEIVALARELLRDSASGGVTIDTLANALKSRGFRRTPGSPRLITRLRRIRELMISRSGMITVVEPREAEHRPHPESVAPTEHETPAEPLAESADADVAASEAEEAAQAADQPRRRSRRGGRRRRGRGRDAAVAEQEPAAS